MATKPQKTSVYERIQALTKIMIREKYATRARHAVSVWKCGSCGGRGLVGFKRPLVKSKNVFQYIEACAFCGHRTAVRHFNNKTKKFTKGERFSNGND